MKEDILGIISGVEKELENLVELRGEMQRVKSEKEIVFQRSKGSILHDFYNCCERVFKKIAIEVNSGYDESEKWHKNLLYQMTTPIEGIRPRVISDELAADLDEFLAFRHLFRNIYGFELKGNRIDYLVGKFERVAEEFRREAQVFLTFLRNNLDESR
jgi:hypothetical protein